MTIGIFSKYIFNNAIFNTDSGTPLPPDTHDGGADYIRRRKKHAKLQEEALYSRTIDAHEIAQEIRKQLLPPEPVEIEIPVPVIPKREILRLPEKYYIDRMPMSDRDLWLKQDDEEVALLLLH